MEKEVDYSQELKSIETECIKCPSCGGTLVFNPETQTLTCSHCGNSVDFEKNKKVVEHDINEGFDKAERWNEDEQATYKCDNCGATIIVGADDEATKCPFCGTTHIIKSGSFDGLRPQAVVPFAFNAEKATQYAKKWAKSRIFAPRKYKKELNQENIRGVYEPCFTYDSKTFSTYEGRVGYRRTRTVGSGKNRRTETYIQYKHISGTISDFFDDVLIANNERFDQDKLNKLAPYKTENACVYQKSYLSGFVADGYTKGLKEGWNDAKCVMDAAIRNNIKNKHCADVVDYINVSTVYSDVTYKYLLLPVYFANYRYAKKDYGVMVNGSTGKVKGKAPISPLRATVAALLGAGIIVGIALLYSYFGV